MMRQLPQWSYPLPVDAYNFRKKLSHQLLRPLKIARILLNANPTKEKEEPVPSSTWECGFPTLMPVKSL
jgi:hypothetical protein